MDIFIFLSDAIVSFVGNKIPSYVLQLFYLGISITNLCNSIRWQFKNYREQSCGTQQHNLVSPSIDLNSNNQIQKMTHRFVDASTYNSTERTTEHSTDKLKLDHVDIYH